MGEESNIAHTIAKMQSRLASLEQEIASQFNLVNMVLKSKVHSLEATKKELAQQTIGGPSPIKTEIGGRPRFRKRHECSTMGISNKQAFEKLFAQGLITPVGPTLDPPIDKRFAKWDKSKYCKNHCGHGHSTKECICLKDRIQDMIDDGHLPILLEGKKPSI